MTNFSDLGPDSSLTDVLGLYPAHAPQLLRLVNDVMCDDGALSRGDRERIAAHVSDHNDVPYCQFFHSMFADAFCATSRGAEQLKPLLSYADALLSGQQTQIQNAHQAALAAGWTEPALYEVVEVTGLFNLINTIVLAAGLRAPQALPDPAPKAQDLQSSYLDMAAALAPGSENQLD